MSSLHKKRYTRKKKLSKRRTQRNQSGGDRSETYFFIVSDSETRKNYPVMRVINMHGDGKSGFFQFEEYLSDIAYDVEDYLTSLVRNKEGKRLPKQMRIKKYIVRKPVYIPQFE